MEENVTQRKKFLRRQVADFRDSLAETECRKKSEAIFLRIRELDNYVNAKRILVYVSTKKEVDTRKIIENALADGKIVGVPRVIGKGHMEFYVIHGMEDLKESYFGIPQPLGTCEKIERQSITKQDLMLLPGVAFDREGNRLGYGGGFYDRYLAESNPYRLALCFEEQIMNEVPVDIHDLPMQKILTDRREYLVNPRL